MSGFGLVSFFWSAIWRPTSSSSLCIECGTEQADLPPCIFCGTILTCVQTTQMNSNDLSIFFFIPPVPNEEGIRASRGRHRLQDQGRVRCGHLEGLSCSSSTIPTARKVTQNLGEVFVIQQSEGHLQGFLFFNPSTLWHNVAWCVHNPPQIVHYVCPMGFPGRTWASLRCARQNEMDRPANLVAAAFQQVFAHGPLSFVHALGPRVLTIGDSMGFRWFQP